MYGNFFDQLDLMMSEAAISKNLEYGPRVAAEAVRDVNRVICTLLNDRVLLDDKDKAIDRVHALIKSAEWLLALSVLLQVGPEASREEMYKKMSDRTEVVAKLLAKMMIEAKQAYRSYNG